MPRVYMRGDYYVVPPNGARIHTCVRPLLRIAPAGAPDYHNGGQFASPNANGIWANILYQKGGSAAIPQTN